ncbi:MAG: hypothetical protein VB046_09610 [Paludibacter sp.]|nr:hypothetical protein [Paludibacter sp.]
MEIVSNSDKRAFICKAFAGEVDKMSFVNYPGDMCRLDGTSNEIHFSDISFSESESVNGEPIEQNLQFVFRGQSQTFDRDSKLLIGKPNFIILHYSNGDIRVVGTKDNPVFFSKSKSGRVVENIIESKRFSAEPAKYLIKISD